MADKPEYVECVFLVNDADALFAEFKRRGAKIDYDIGDKPYDVREFGVQDLDGYDIGFGQLKSLGAER